MLQSSQKRLDSIYRIQSDLDSCISFPEGFLTHNYMAIASPYVNEPKEERTSFENDCLKKFTNLQF